VEETRKETRQGSWRGNLGPHVRVALLPTWGRALQSLPGVPCHWWGFAGGDRLVSAIASLSSSAANKNHEEDLLHSWLHAAYGIRLDPFFIDVEIKSRRTDQDTERIALPILAPHEIFAAAYAAGPACFSKVFVGVGGQSELEAYWRNASRQQWGREHPALSAA
jgi:hypothetical protein